MIVNNIAIELPTYVIKAVRCHSPVGLSDIGHLLLDHYTNPISIFDLVSFGDIDTLAATTDDTIYVPAPIQQKKGKRILNPYVFEMYSDRNEFADANRTEPRFLFMYSYRTNRWEFLDRSLPSTSGWIDLTKWFIKDQER
jgi:hypothetical protein